MLPFTLLAVFRNFSLAITRDDRQASHTLSVGSALLDIGFPTGLKGMAVTHLIDENHKNRMTPAAGEKVRIKGFEGLFLVLRINRAAGTADLLNCANGLHSVEAAVPLALLQPGYDYLPELFRWYVEAAPVR